MSFGQNVAATKIELLKYKRSSQVATMVQKILDDKRKVLLKNIEEMIQEASKARGGIWPAWPHRFRVQVRIPAVGWLLGRRQ